MVANRLDLSIPLSKKSIAHLIHFRLYLTQSLGLGLGVRISDLRQFPLERNFLFRPLGLVLLAQLVNGDFLIIRQLDPLFSPNRLIRLLHRQFKC